MGISARDLGSIYTPVNRSIQLSRRLLNRGAGADSLTADCNYEAFYNGYWRDIHDDYEYKISKVGNEYVSAKRCDGGYRNYRVDRGLVIRPKEDDDDDNVINNVNPGLTNIGTDFFKGVQRGLITGGLTSAGLRIGSKVVPKNVGSKISAFAKSGVGKKLAIAAIGIGIGIDIYKIATGERSVSETLGGKAGGFLGAGLSKRVFNSKVLNSYLNKESSINEKIKELKNNIPAKFKTRVRDTYNLFKSNFTEKVPTLDQYAKTFAERQARSKSYNYNTPSVKQVTGSTSSSKAYNPMKTVKGKTTGFLLTDPRKTVNRFVSPQSKDKISRNLFQQLSDIDKRKALPERFKLNLPTPIEGFKDESYFDIFKFTTDYLIDIGVIR